MPIIHSVYTILLAIITATRAPNMLPTISKTVSPISPNYHCMPHVTTTSRCEVGWMQRWTIPGALIVIKHLNVKTAHHDLDWCNSILTAKQQQLQAKTQKLQPCFHLKPIYRVCYLTHHSVYPYMVISDSTMTKRVSMGLLFYQAVTCTGYGHVSMLMQQPSSLKLIATFTLSYKK